MRQEEIKSFKLSFASLKRQENGQKWLKWEQWFGRGYDKRDRGE